MTEPTSSQTQDVAAGASTITVAPTDTQDHEVPTVRLKLRKPKTGRKVQWTTGTVDNEHLNKKKSKCCCIYKKPKEFGESSSDEDSDDECDHCKGHMEKKGQKQADSVDLVSEEDVVDVPPPHINGGDPPHSQ